MSVDDGQGAYGYHRRVLYFMATFFYPPFIILDLSLSYTFPLLISSCCLSYHLDSIDIDGPRATTDFKTIPSCRNTESQQSNSRWNSVGGFKTH
jgi:hypothetical protein